MVAFCQSVLLKRDDDDDEYKDKQQLLTVQCTYKM